MNVRSTDSSTGGDCHIAYVWDCITGGECRFTISSYCSAVGERRVVCATDSSTGADCGLISLFNFGIAAVSLCLVSFVQ